MLTSKAQLPATEEYNIHKEKVKLLLKYGLLLLVEVHFESLFKTQIFLPLEREVAFSLLVFKPSLSLILDFKMV